MNCKTGLTGMNESKPSSTEVSWRMRRVRQKRTAPEMLIRRLLHKMNVRYRVNSLVEPYLRARPDISIKKYKLAIYIDGCFWHACPIHASWPKSNSEWWKEKIEGNVLRDRRHKLELESCGWTVMRFWEHEIPEEVARHILEFINKNK